MEATVSLRTRRDNSTRHLLTAHPDLFFDFESLAKFILAVPKYYLVHDTIFASTHAQQKNVALVLVASAL